MDWISAVYRTTQNYNEELPTALLERLIFVSL